MVNKPLTGEKKQALAQSHRTTEPQRATGATHPRQNGFANSFSTSDRAAHMSSRSRSDIRATMSRSRARSRTQRNHVERIGAHRGERYCRGEVGKGRGGHGINSRLAAISKRIRTASAAATRDWVPAAPPPAGLRSRGSRGRVPKDAWRVRGSGGQTRRFYPEEGK
jgi:hypothetical protein